MPGPHRSVTSPSTGMRPARRSHRWLGPSVDLPEAPAWIQRDARACLAGGPPVPPDVIDPIALALAADSRHARREAWLGVLFGLGAVGLMVQGWLLPLLAAAFVAAPVVGVLLAILDRDTTD